jgi:hypothetical protein
MKVLCQYVMFGTLDEELAKSQKFHQSAMIQFRDAEVDTPLEAICELAADEVKKDMEEQLSRWIEVYAHGCIFIGGEPCFFFTAYHGNCPGCEGRKEPHIHIEGASTKFGSRRLFAQAGLSMQTAPFPTPDKEMMN